MALPAANFPASVWDGNEKSTANDVAGSDRWNGADANEMAAEVVAIQTALAKLVDASGDVNVPACAVDRIGGISASDDRFIFVAPSACVVTKAYLVSDTATSSSDGTDNYEFQVENKTQAEDLASSAKSTNGAEIAGDTAYDLGLDQNLTLAAGDVLELQITKNNAPTDLSSAEVSAFLHYKLRE